jgi:hypothetical protein
VPCQDGQFDRGAGERLSGREETKKVRALQLNVKVFARPTDVKPRELSPVFHRWIQTHALDEVMVDVADYGHVPGGPGVLLICHAAHYGFEGREGRTALVYTRKRDASGTLEEQIASAFGSALLACAKLEAEPALSGRLVFPGSEVELSIRDRLQAPNTAQTFERVRPALDGVLGRLYAGAFSMAHVAQAGECFGVSIAAPGAPGAAALLSRVRTL